jgi:hypothetical protein
MDAYVIFHSPFLINVSYAIQSAAIRMIVGQQRGNIDVINSGLMEKEELKVWRAGVVDIVEVDRDADIPIVNGARLGGLQAVRARAKYNAREAAAAEAAKQAEKAEKKA